MRNRRGPGVGPPRGGRGGEGGLRGPTAAHTAVHPPVHTATPASIATTPSIHPATPSEYRLDSRYDALSTANSARTGRSRAGSVVANGSLKRHAVWALQGLLPLIPAEVQGVKLQQPITAWWNELFAVEGNCEKCSLTVLYTLIEFMCLMAVPTVVGALLVLFAAFAPAAADAAIAIKEEKVGSRVLLASLRVPFRSALCRELRAPCSNLQTLTSRPTGRRSHSSGRRSRQRSRSPSLGQGSTSSLFLCCRWRLWSARSARCCSP